MLIMQPQGFAYHFEQYQPLVTDTPGTQSYDSYYVAAYVVLAAYVGFVMKRLDRVHSRMGMLLVAIVSMASSGMLSLSVCKLLGFSVDNVPWKLLPLLMIVLAVDNTWLLTHAVVSTSVDLPIPERVGAGVAKVGPQILLALIVEHILLFLAFILIPVRAVREMTLLGAIALKADAAMQMTFFLPILSIDIQRLEVCCTAFRHSFNVAERSYSSLICCDKAGSQCRVQLDRSRTRNRRSVSLRMRGMAQESD